MTYENQLGYGIADTAVPRSLDMALCCPTSPGRCIDPRQAHTHGQTSHIQWRPVGEWCRRWSVLLELDFSTNERNTPMMNCPVRYTIKFLCEILLSLNF